MSADPLGFEMLLSSQARPAGAQESFARWHIPLLLLLCAALYLGGLGLRPLWDTDEGMHAATARAMLESGDWLTPRFNGEPFYDKPALFTWLVALSFQLLGFSEFAARLPAGLLGTGGVVLTYLLGRRIGGPELGWIAALVLATCFEYVALSISVVHDIALSCAILLALLGFWGCVDQEEPHARHAWMFWLGSALALLSKGPVGLLPIGLAALFIAVTGRRDVLRSLRVVRGALLMVAVAGPWFLAMAWQHPDYVQSFVVERALGSFAQTNTHHARPFYYYVPVLLGGLLPWSTYLPLAFGTAVRTAIVDRDAGTRFLLLWLGATFAIFSLASSKLATYLLPVLPAAALLVGAVWRDALRSGAARRALWLPKLALVAGLLGALPALYLQPPERWLSGDMRVEDTLHLAVVALAGQALTAGFLLASRLRAALLAEVATIAALFLVFTLSTAPRLESHRSSKHLAERLERWLPPGAPIPFFARVVGIGDGALFYSGRRARVLREPHELSAYLRSPDPVICVLAEMHLSRVSSVDFHIVERVGDRLIISNTPAP